MQIEKQLQSLIEIKGKSKREALQGNQCAVAKWHRSIDFFV
jgi:hypothetical protein